MPTEIQTGPPVETIVSVAHVMPDGTVVTMVWHVDPAIAERVAEVLGDPHAEVVATAEESRAQAALLSTLEHPVMFA